MIKTSSKNSFPIYYIVEAAVNPDDIQTTILRENTVIGATGEKIKTVTVDSTLQSFDVINWNQRRYPTQVVMRGLDENPKIQNHLRRKQFAGEYGHPDSKEMSRQSQVLPEKTSHYIDNYRKVGNLLKGHVTSAPYGYGIWMYNTAMADRPWAFSLRAFGGVDSNNVAIHPLTIITYDQVNGPSHKEAYSDKGDIVSVKSYTDAMLKESSSMTLLESSSIVSNITNFVMERSDNIKIAKDLFGLQESSGVYDNKNTVVLEGTYLGQNITVHVPLESYIRDYYRDIMTFK